MIFTKDNLKFSILDAIALDYGKINTTIPPRPFHALSLRLETDAVLHCANRTLDMQAGSVTYFPAEVSYRRSCTYDKMLVIHLDIQNYVGYTLESITPQKTDVKGYFEKIVRLYTEKQGGYRYLAQALLNNMLAEIYDEYFDGTNIPKVIENAVKTIHERYTDPSLSVAELAKVSGVSEVYLRRVFNKTFGVGPKQYITDMRIEYAKSLLNTDEMPIASVALRAGFSEPKHFAVAFSKKTGYPPSKHGYHFGKGKQQ